MALAVTAMFGGVAVFLPAVTRQLTEVFEDQAAVPQKLKANSLVGEKSVMRKLRPVTVTVPPSVMTMLWAHVKLTIGAVRGGPGSEGARQSGGAGDASYRRT